MMITKELLVNIQNKLDEIADYASRSTEIKKERYVVKTTDHLGETPEIVSREKYLELLLDVIIQDLYSLSEDIYLSTGVLGKEG